MRKYAKRNNLPKLFGALAVVALALSAAALPAAFAFADDGAEAVNEAVDENPSVDPPAAEPANIESAVVKLSKSQYAYTGKAVKPVPAVSLNGVALVKGTDYRLSYTSNAKVGKASVTVTGINDYTGKVSKSFRIVYLMSKAKASKVKTVTYRAKAYKPKPTVKYGKVKLKKGRDYKLTYKSNKNAGTAKIVITGKGNCVGKKTVKFKIKKASISSAKVSSVSDKKYTGSKIKPKPKVKLKGKTLKRGRDYKLVYSNNKSAGTAKITVKAIGNYKGKKTVKFKIYKPVKKKSSSASSKGSTGGGTVYWTPSGSVYHYSRGCSTLSRSSTVYSGSKSESGKSRACKVCG